MAVVDSDLDLVPEDEEDEVCVKYDIATYPSDFTLTGMVDLWNAGDIVIPDCSLFEGWRSYEKPMKDYLNKVMSQDKRFASPKARRFKESFLHACEEILTTLGTKPFNPRGQLNTSILDAVFITLLEHNGPVPSNLKSRYASLIADAEFTNKTRRATTDTATVHERIAMAKRVLIA